VIGSGSSAIVRRGRHGGLNWAGEERRGFGFTKVMHGLQMLYAGGDDLDILNCSGEVLGQHTTGNERTRLWRRVTQVYDFGKGGGA
jgi:hypothetical protein